MRFKQSSITKKDASMQLSGYICIGTQIPYAKNGKKMCAFLGDMHEIMFLAELAEILVFLRRKVHWIYSNHSTKRDFTLIFYI